MPHIKHRNDTKPSVAMLRACVEYDQTTGVFTWKARPVEHFTDARAAASWNTRFAGRLVRKRSRGYFVICITVDQQELHCRAHRVAWALMTGAWPEMEVDHQDRDRGNNRWANLRQATHQENQWNKGASARSKTGVKGVHVHSQNGTFIAQIKDGGKTRHLGSFSDLGEAGAAYQAAEANARDQFAESHQ